MSVRLVLKEVDEDLIGWLRHIGFWNDQIAERVKKANSLLPMDLELELRDYVKGKINKFCLVILNHSKSDSRGINIRNFDLSCLDHENPDIRVEVGTQIDYALLNDECACETLMRMGLARLDDEILKPLKAAFDPRVVDFIGLRFVY